MQGDSYKWRFVLWEDEDKTRPVSLKDVQIEPTIRDGEKIWTLLVDIYPPNTIIVELPRSVSEYLKGGMWSLRLVWPDGTARTVIRGNVQVTVNA